MSFPLVETLSAFTATFFCLPDTANVENEDHTHAHDRKRHVLGNVVATLVLLVDLADAYLDLSFCFDLYNATSDQGNTDQQWWALFLALGTATALLITLYNRAVLSWAALKVKRQRFANRSDSAQATSSNTVDDSSLKKLLDVERSFVVEAIVFLLEDGAVAIVYGAVNGAYEKSWGTRLNLYASIVSGGLGVIFFAVLERRGEERYEDAFERTQLPAMARELWQEHGYDEQEQGRVSEEMRQRMHQHLRNNTANVHGNMCHMYWICFLATLLPAALVYFAVLLVVLLVRDGWSYEDRLVYWSLFLYCLVSCYFTGFALHTRMAASGYKCLVIVGYYFIFAFWIAYGVFIYMATR